LIPSDPAEVALRVNDITPTEADIHKMRELLGLNRPFFLRYFDWLWKSLHFDFGISYVNTNRKVTDEIARSLPVTLKMTRVIVFLGTAIPDYWLSLILLSIFALKLNIFPISGVNSVSGYILPAFALSMNYISIYVRLIRANMIETLEQDHIYYAKVRGLSKKSIIFRHALKNSIHSSLNALGMSVVKLVAGTFIIENIFVLPGIGRLCVQAVFGRDYPIIQAYVLIMGVLFIVCNLIVDIASCYIDPRMVEKEV